MVLDLVSLHRMTCLTSPACEKVWVTHPGSNNCFHWPTTLEIDRWDQVVRLWEGTHRCWLPPTRPPTLLVSAHRMTCPKSCELETFNYPPTLVGCPTTLLAVWTTVVPLLIRPILSTVHSTYPYWRRWYLLWKNEDVFEEKNCQDTLTKKYMFWIHEFVYDTSKPSQIIIHVFYCIWLIFSCTQYMITYANTCFTLVLKIIHEKVVLQYYILYYNIFYTINTTNKLYYLCVLYYCVNK